MAGVESIAFFGTAGQVIPVLVLGALFILLAHDEAVFPRSREMADTNADSDSLSESGTPPPGEPK